MLIKIESSHAFVSLYAGLSKLRVGVKTNINTPTLSNIVKQTYRLVQNRVQFEFWIDLVSLVGQYEKAKIGPDSICFGPM